MAQELSPYEIGAEISLGDFIGLFRARWVTLVLLPLAGAALALGFAFLVPKRYDATVVMAPVTSQGGSGGLAVLAGSLAGQLTGGLSSLAGLAGEASGEKIEAIATLQSDALLRAYIEKNDLLPLLFRSDWDPEARQWKTNPPPTVWTGVQLMKNRVRTVTENARNGLVTLNIRWTDPVVAARWANDLVKATNDRLKEQAISEARRSIDYLNEQATRTNVVEIRNAIFALAEVALKKEMVAQGSEAYALKVIDPATPAEKAAFPPRILWLLAGAALGLMIATSMILLGNTGWAKGASSEPSS